MPQGNNPSFFFLSYPSFATHTGCTDTISAKIMQGKAEDIYRCNHKGIVSFCGKSERVHISACTRRLVEFKNGKEVLEQQLESMRKKGTVIEYSFTERESNILAAYLDYRDADFYISNSDHRESNRVKAHSVHITTESFNSDFIKLVQLQLVVSELLEVDVYVEDIADDIDVDAIVSIIAESAPRIKDLLTKMNIQKIFFEEGFNNNPTIFLARKESFGRAGARLSIPITNSAIVDRKFNLAPLKKGFKEYIFTIIP